MPRPRPSPWRPLLLALLGLLVLAGLWTARRGLEAPPTAPPPHARGEPAPGAALDPDPPRLPVDCPALAELALPPGARLSWRSTLRGDAQLPADELLERILVRSRPYPPGQADAVPSAPEQADLLLVLDGAAPLASFPLAWAEGQGRCLPRSVEVHRSTPAGAGIGISLAMEAEGARVISLHPGGPAAQAGLRPGELIRALDGGSIAGWSLAQVVERILGPDGSALTLTVQDEAGGVRELGIRRSPLAEDG